MLIAESQNMTDDELVKRCLRNDTKTQKIFFQRFAPKMMGVCLRYSDCEADAEDMLQDGLIKVFAKLNMFSGTGSLEGWIRRIIVNNALDTIRRNKKRKLDTNIDDVAFSLKNEPNIIEDISAKELLKLLQTIPLGYRTVFNLYAIEGYSHKEIAQKLEITVSTSKSQLSRARAVLREIIEKKNLL